jgi:hypothetical protein
VAERVRVRDITNDEGNRLLRIVPRSSGSVVTWRRVQMVLLSAQGRDVPALAKVTFTSPDRVRDVVPNLQPGPVRCLSPRYAGGRPPTFALAQRRQIKQVALSRPRITSCRSRPGAWPSWPSSWSTITATRACGSCSARKACPFK